MRRGGDHITVLEGVGKLASSHKTARVSDVGHEERAMLVSNLAESLVIPVAGVRRGTADDQAGLVDLRQRRNVLVVHELRRRVKTVGERLEVDGGGRHLLLRGLR